MKFSIQREAILKPLQLINGVVERRQTLPILSNILISVSKDRLSMTGTDLEVELVIDIPLSAGEPGDITIPARKFLDICRTLPDEALIEVVVEEERALIRSGKSRFTIATLPATDFPSMDTIHNPYEFTLPQQQLKYLIDKTSFAMAQQDVRYYLNGMMMELTDNTLRTVATDGHRLAMGEISADIKVDEAKQVIIPRKGIMELSRLLEDSEESLQIKLGTNHIRISLPEISFTSKLIDGRFPDYKRVLPQGSDKLVIVDKETMKQALVRTAILSNEKYRGIRINLNKGSMQVVANNPELEEAEEEFSVDYQGGDLEIGFNVNYLVDALSVIEGEQAQISMADSNSSCLIKPVDSSDTKYVIMPMRL
jgi:DNA polymerase-3 subunit beta